MKRKKVLISLLAVMLLCVMAVGVLTACNNDNDDTPEKFTVTFKNGETVVTTLSNIEKGTALTANQIPTLSDVPADKEFKGWYVGEGANATKVEAGYVVNGNVTAVAKLEDKIVSITFTNDGETVGTPLTNLAYGTALTAEQIPTLSDIPADKEFKGWYVGEGANAVKVEAGYEVTGNVIAVAKIETKEFTVTFKNGETVVQTITREINTELTENDIPALSNIPADKDFLGWYIGEGQEAVKVEVGYKVTGNVIAVAKLETKAVTIANEYLGEWETVDGSYSYTLTVTEHGILVTTDGDDFNATDIAERVGGGYTFNFAYSETYIVECELYFDDDVLYFYNDDDDYTYELEIYIFPYANTTWISAEGIILVFGADEEDIVKFDLGEGFVNGEITEYEKGDYLSVNVSGTTYTFWIYTDELDVEIDGHDGDVYLYKHAIPEELQNTTWVSTDGFKLIFGSETVQFDNGSGFVNGYVTADYDEDYVCVKVSGTIHKFWINSSYLEFGDYTLDKQVVPEELQNTLWVSETDNIKLILGTSNVQFDLGNGLNYGFITDYDEDSLSINVAGTTYKFWIYSECLELDDYTLDKQDTSEPISISFPEVYIGTWAKGDYTIVISEDSIIVNGVEAVINKIDGFEYDDTWYFTLNGEEWRICVFGDRISLYNAWDNFGVTISVPNIEKQAE